MIKPVMTKLSKSILNSILPKEIIYAEVAGAGAMGNSGGIMLYYIEGEQLICYETNIFSDNKNYLLAEELLLRHQSRFKTADLNVGVELFDYFDGSMGNNVFVNKNVNLEIREEYFIYKKDNVEYQILSSVQGVFYYLVNTMKDIAKNNLY